MEGFTKLEPIINTDAFNIGDLLKITISKIDEYYVETTIVRYGVITQINDFKIEITSCNSKTMNKNLKEKLDITAKEIFNNEIQIEILKGN